VTVREINGKFEYFWVFVPRYDAWRLGRFAGDAQIPVVCNGGMWTILPVKVEDFEAVGIEMPNHPRSTVVPKLNPS
jgi:hypothetical protein